MVKELPWSLSWPDRVNSVFERGGDSSGEKPPLKPCSMRGIGQAFRRSGRPRSHIRQGLRQAGGFEPKPPSPPALAFHALAAAAVVLGLQVVEQLFLVAEDFLCGA